MNKDYYQTLGVLDDAEDVVIRAAYRALAQKYHPDKWGGSQNEANARMSEINEAFEVLSDPEKRRNYDSTRGKSEYAESDSTEEQEDELLSAVERDWMEVLDFFPDLEYSANQLSKISKQLEFSFKTILLETKKFNNRNDIAKKLEEHYLQKFFGKNPKIVQYAKALILDGNKKAAKDLNRAVDLLGPDVDPDLIIRKVSAKNAPYRTADRAGVKIQDAIKYAEHFKSSPCFHYSKCLIESLGGSVTDDKNNLLFSYVEYEGQNYAFNREELFHFTHGLIEKLTGKKAPNK